MASETLAFDDEQIVESYLCESDLQRPEETVLSNLAHQMGGFSMLDLGVGAGRTTLHFAKWVGNYEGVDISEKMIRACKARFSKYPMQLTFRVGDATNLEWIDDSTKDFVLFSYNGIDYVDHERRQTIFAEVHRVLKPNGYFLFSTHNLLAVDHLFSFRKQYSRNPVTFLRNLRRWVLINYKYNSRTQIRNRSKVPFQIINDGAYDFALSTYYVQPAEQLRQLQPYFQNVQMYSIADGREKPLEKLGTDDYWIYYFCQKTSG